MFLKFSFSRILKSIAFFYCKLKSNLMSCSSVKHFRFLKMKFPEKLWSLVNECTTGAIGWGKEDNTIVIDFEKFESEFLGENSDIFKTKNAVSFIRQLNLYGFRKLFRQNNVHEFRHPYFVRGKKNLLKLLQRRFRFSDTPKKGLKKRNIVQNTRKDLHGKDLKPVPSSNIISHPFQNSSFSTISSNQIQNSNLMSNGWWGNSYNAMNNMFLNEDTFNNKGCVDGEEIKQASPYWGNLNMYKNVIFVPVPAQYGFYPGLYDNMPFSMQQQSSDTMSVPFSISSQSYDNMTMPFAASLQPNAKMAFASTPQSTDNVEKSFTLPMQPDSNVEKSSALSSQPNEMGNSSASVLQPSEEKSLSFAMPPQPIVKKGSYFCTTEV